MKNKIWNLHLAGHPKSVIAVMCKTSSQEAVRDVFKGGRPYPPNSLSVASPWLYAPLKEVWQRQPSEM